jgi:penicillin amidase
MRSWSKRLLIGALIVLATVFASIWFTIRASLPQLDGEIRVVGLQQTATIIRDRAGIPTIMANDRRDLAFATGFAHGQDRFFQMDLIRRQAAGELSELFGELAVDADKRFRFHRFRDRARAVLQQTPAADKAILDSYTAGVNAGLESLRARPFEHLLLGVEPRPWSAVDSLLVVYTMYTQLNDGRASHDVRRGFARRALPAEVYAWLYPEGTSWDAPIMGGSRLEARPPSASMYSIREVTDEAPPAGEIGKKHLNGSNNWVVSGALTGNGRARMSNDMHLGHGVPNIWYQARLITGGDEPRNVTGVTLPGTPFVIAGSNGSVAWGYTNSYGDWVDAVLLRPGAKPGTYRTPQGDLAFEIRRETINVKDGEPVNYEFRETIWGPVEDRTDYPDGDIAVSWIAHSPEAVNLRLISLESAFTVEQALDIAVTLGMPPQNFVAGDAGGNIGWTIAGQIPVKAEFDPWLPADWSTEEGWLGWLHPADYPRVVNPPNNRIYS